MLVCFPYIAREAAGAAGTRFSLRTLSFSRDDVGAKLGRKSRRGNADTRYLSCHHPRKRVIQYSRDFWNESICLWNTESPGPVFAEASAGQRVRGLAGALAEAASRAMTSE